MPIITKYYPRIPGQKRKVRERYVVDEHGIKQGLYQSYYKDGQDQVTCLFKDGVKHGHYVSKHQNGRVATECTYDEGCLEGRFVRWDKMGRMLFDGHFHRNLGEGQQTYYRVNGEVASWEHLHQGKREGECITWCYDEVKHQIYQEDTPTCTTKMSIGRTTKMVQEFSNNVPVRQVNFIYNAEQALEEKVEFEQNTDIAVHTYYFPSGQVRLVCGKKYDSMEGPFVRYFESGRKAEEGRCENNKIHGAQILYYDNEENSIKEESHFVKGQLDGVCIRRDETGKVVEKCHYENGKRVVYTGMAEALFQKMADQTERNHAADQIIDLRRKGQRKEAVLLARQFHSEQSDIPRRTALKMGQENCRS